MQEMTRAFNDEGICRNLYRFMGEEVKETEFAWLTSIEITKSNAKKIVRTGRNR